MTTLQEYLDQKYLTPEAKEQVKQIIIRWDSSDEFPNTITWKQAKELEGKELDLTEYSSLETIIIHGYCLKSKLTSLDVSNCAKLSDLDCSRNELTDLDLINCPKLKKIDCRNNKFTEQKLAEIKQVVNDNWQIIHPDFTPLLQELWERKNWKGEIQGFTADQVQQWINKGLTPTDYILANYCQRKGINPNQELNLTELRKEQQNDLDWKDIYKDFKFRQQKWEKNNLTYQDAREWISIGFKPYDYKAVKQWKDRGFDYQATKEWKEVLGKNFEVSDWAFCAWLRDEKHLTPQQVQQQNNLESLKQKYNKIWTDIHPDFTPKLQKNWERHGLNYEETQAWIQAGFKPADYEKFSYWKNLNFTSQEIKPWLNIGLELDDWEIASQLKQNNLTPEQYKNKTSQNLLDLIYSNKTQVERIILNYLESFQPSELVIDGYSELNWIFGEKISNLTNLTIQNCPKLEEINIKESKNLLQLILNDLPNLKELSCNSNNLTNLEITNCANLQKIECYENKLANLDLREFDNLEKINCRDNKLTQIKLPQGEKLEDLDLRDNNLHQDLSFLKDLVNLKELDLKNNPLYGSLEPLKDMNKLETLCIDDTDLNSGLEYLPESVETFWYSVDERPEAKCQAIYNLFANEQREVETEYGRIKNLSQKFQAWRQANPDLVNNAQQITELEKILHNFNLALINGKVENETTSSALDTFQFETEERITTMRKQNQEYYQAQILQPNFPPK